MKKDEWKNPKTAAIIFFIWRLLLCFPLVFLYLVPFRKGFEYTTLWGYTEPFTPLSNPLLYPWANFDGVHYLTIAAQGYTTNARFLPLYPMFIKGIALVFGDIKIYSFLSFAIALILSNLFFLLGLYVLYRLLRLDYNSDKSKLSLLALLFFPTSFFFGAVYSESLFFLLSVLVFYFSRNNKWWLAGICGAFASATRVVGVVFFLVLLVEYVEQRQKDIRKIVASLIALTGTLIYAAYNYVKWGDPVYFIRQHGELSNGRATGELVFPLQTFYRYIKMLILVSPSVYEWWIVFLELSVFLFVLFSFYLMWKQNIRKSYALFAVFAIVIPVLSGTLSGLPRYILPLFPIFIALADIDSRVFRYAYMFAGIILSFILLILFAQGYYIA